MSADSTTRRPASGYVFVLAVVFGVSVVGLGLVFLIGMATIFGDLDAAADTPASSIASSITKSFRSSDLSPEDLYEQVAPSVVTIIVKDEDGEAIGSGSGFLIDEGDLPKRYRSSALYLRHNFLTNYHVIRPAVGLDIVLYDGQKCFGASIHVIAEDEKSDLALLSAYLPTDHLRGIALSQKDPRVLTTVYAIGSPKGLIGSASEGKISGIREVSPNEHWLQTTASTSPGSSGGPLLLTDGTLAGVTTANLKDAKNINFAIPASQVRKFLTTSEFRHREVEEGASISWHERSAISDVEFELWRTGITFEEAQIVIGFVEKASECVRYGLWPTQGSDEPLSQYWKVIALAEEANKSLPPETKYLTYYLIGKAEYWMGVRTAGKSNSIYTTDRQAAYRATKHAKRASYHLSEATRLKPDFSPAYDVLADHFRSSGKFRDALLISDRLVNVMPRCADAFAKRAQFYMDLGQTEAAKDDLRTAVLLSPRNWRHHKRLGIALARLGEFAAASASCERAQEFAEHKVSAGIITHFDVGILHYEMGQAFKTGGNANFAIAEFIKAQAVGIPCQNEIAECRRRIP